MNDTLGLIFKVVVGSGLISAAIKYLGPLLAVPATSGVAIAIVLIPPIVVTGLLGWRLQRDRT